MNDVLQYVMTITLFRQRNRNLIIDDNKTVADNIRVETVCENSVLELQCPDSLRLAIHSAVFGRTRDSLVPQSVFSSSPPPPQCVTNHTSYDTGR